MEESVDRVSMEETSPDELLALLEHSEEIRLELPAGGAARSVRVRKRGGTYYCDTSVKLYSFESREQFVSWMERVGIRAPPAASGT